SNHVFEHIPHPIAMLRDLKARLKPGGIVVIMVPIEDFRTKRNADWQSPDVNQHLHTWTPLQFAHTLREAGFTPQDVRTITSAWTHKTFFLGDGMLQKLFCNLFARYRKSRQVLAVAKKA
ncbi:MAG: class I SAM-dependent methyltransferase, partial [Primorskyibacter sp.]